VIAYQIRVFGSVQGVGFRYYTREQAVTQDLSGSVENQSDGTVLINVEGDARVVHDFLEWCHKGPSSSIVDKLEYVAIELSNCKAFKIIRYE